MKQNICVQIVPSAELRQMGLEELAGYRGFIVEDLASSERRVKGYMVLLEEAYQNEFLWFIPKMSIVYE